MRDMPKFRVQYEPFAWWLTREQIGRDLREHYAAQELSPRLLKLVRKLDEAEGNQELSPRFPSRKPRRP